MGVKEVAEHVIETAIDEIIDRSNDLPRDISEVDELVNGMNKQFGTNYVINKVTRRLIIQSIKDEWG